MLEQRRNPDAVGLVTNCRKRPCLQVSKSQNLNIPKSHYLKTELYLYFMKVLVYGKYLEEVNLPYVTKVLSKLKERCEYRVNDVFATEMIQQGMSVDLERIVSATEDIKVFSPDICISLGGDGTILTAATLIQDLAIPIVGINLGRLGFLASTEKTVIDKALDFLFAGDYKIEKRAMLSLESSIPIFEGASFALNDFTLHKRDTSSMVTIHAYVDGEFLNSYWADGIIVSTPTGSTGYNLSCGGPIIYPDSQNFVITPVAPHNLNVRPLIIPESSKISFEIEGRSENFMCTLDSRYETVTADHKLVIQKCNFYTHLIRLEDSSFLKTIRGKLAWGRDSRN